MYKLICFLILSTVFSTQKIFIRNTELPNCFNCLHFIEYKNNYPYDPIPCNTQYGKCKKFGEVNLITGVIEYDFANNCRNDVNKCGKLGSEYMKKIEY
jgi:hypothetical protein